MQSTVTVVASGKVRIRNDPAMALGGNEAIIAEEEAGELLAPLPTVKQVDAGEILASTSKDDGLSEYCIHETTPENFVKE